MTRQAAAMTHGLTTYVFQGTARASDSHSSYTSGERHAIVAFALAGGLDDALRLAENHFLESGWSDVLFEQGAELDPESLNATDPQISRSYEDCQNQGTAGIVFSEPIDD